MSDPKLNLLLTADDKTAAAFAALNNRLSNVEKTSKRASDTFASFGKIAGGIFAATQVIDYAKKLGNVADTYTQLSARIKVVSNSTAEFEMAQKSLFDISQRTRTGFSETADLYAQMARGAKDLNVPQATMLKLTEGINKAIIVSGTSTQAANAALVQLGQGFAAGALRGQEFMSVQEQAPVILETVRKGLGLTQRELKKMAEEGKLTTDTFIRGFMNGMSDLNSQFDQIPVTIGQAFQRLSNQIVKTVGEIDKLTGTSQAISSWITDVANSINNDLVPSMKLAGGFWAALTKFGLGTDPFKTPAEQADMYAKRIRELTNDLERYKKSNADTSAIEQALADARIKQARALMMMQDATSYTKSSSMKNRAALLGREKITPPAQISDNGTLAKRESLLRQVNEQIILMTQGERALAEARAKQIFGKDIEGLKEYMRLWDESEGYRNADRQLDNIADSFAAMRNEAEKSRKAAVKAFEEEEKAANKVFDAIIKESEANRESSDAWRTRQKNIVEDFKLQMQSYKDMLDIRAAGIYQTQEELDWLERRNKVIKYYNQAINTASQDSHGASSQTIRDLQNQRDAALKVIDAYKEISEIQKKDIFGAGVTGFRQYIDEISDFASFTEDATVRAFKGMEDALVNFSKTGKLSFGDLARSIIADLIRIQARQTMLSILGGGLFDGIFGTTIANQTSDPLGKFIQLNNNFSKRATGGPVSSKTPYIVGEKGPELFVPNSGGSIVPNNQLGGGTVINQTINVSTGVQQTVRAEVMSLMPQIAGAAKAAVADAKLRGGSYAAAMR